MYYSTFWMGAAVSALVLVGCASVGEVPSTSSSSSPTATPAEAVWKASDLDRNDQNPIEAQPIAVVETAKDSVKSEQTIEAAKPTQATSSTSKAVTSKAEASAQASSPLDDPKSLLAQRTIYFDFDSCYIKPKYEKMLNAHARYLKNHHADHLLIEGHTDERGSAEYNKQLSERRAENVRHALQYRGVSVKQLKALSIGEVRPKNKAHDAKALAENRRAELVYNPK